MIAKIRKMKKMNTIRFSNGPIDWKSAMTTIFMFGLCETILKILIILKIFPTFTVKFSKKMS